MDENPDVTAAKEAYLKIHNEQDRLTFIDWCRRENDKALFRTIDFAQSDALDELKSGISNGLDKLKQVGERIGDAASKLPDAAGNATSKLDGLMNDLLKGGKK
jgi:hypothetical protein